MNLGFVCSSLTLTTQKANGCSPWTLCCCFLSNSVREVSNYQKNNILLLLGLHPKCYVDGTGKETTCWANRNLEVTTFWESADIALSKLFKGQTKLPLWCFFCDLDIDLLSFLGSFLASSLWHQSNSWKEVLLIIYLESHIRHVCFICFIFVLVLLSLMLFWIFLKFSLISIHFLIWGWKAHIFFT